MFKEKHQACISLERMKNCKTMKSTARISAFTLCNWSSLEAFKKSDEIDIWLICWKQARQEKGQETRLEAVLQVQDVSGWTDAVAVGD